MKETAQPVAPTSARSGTFFPQKPGTGAGTAFFQPKLTVNAPGDAFEQEADRVADAVTRTPAGTGFVQPKLRVGSGVQRKCAHCEEEEKRVQRKGGGEVPEATPAVEATLAQGGQPLDAGTRSWAEGALGQDFSLVKIHTDGVAAHSAANIGARAYTSGSDVVFGTGEFSPNTDSGRHLLAHELTHVVQQGGSGGLVQRESVYQETPDTATRTTDAAGNVVYAGHVDRTQYRNEADRTAARNPITSGRVNVRYNESACQLVVPLRVRFINQTAAFPTSCGNLSGTRNDPVRPVSASVFEATKRRFLTEVPPGLNGWYSVVLDGTSCAPCRTVPVTVEFVEVAATDATADQTVIVTDNSGRSYANYGTGDRQVGLCLGTGGGASTSTLIHEAGHFALGWGDEYHESDAERPRERERLGQFSRMAQDAPSGLQEWHERHFAFAVAFLRGVYPACQPRLERTRRAPLEVEFTLGETGVIPDRGSGDLALSLGVQLGIPLRPMRRLSLMLGPNFTYLVTSQDFMAGFRLGLQSRVTLGNLGPLGTAGLGFRAFGEGGARFDFSSPGIHPTPYAEGGVGLDLRLGDQFRVGFEAARGVMDAGGSAPQPYSRIGGQFGVSF